MGPRKVLYKNPRNLRSGSAPETFLFASRVVGYFDPRLSMRRVFLLVQDKHRGGNFLYLVGNYPYSYALVPPLVFSSYATYFHCLGQPLRTATYPPSLALLLTLRGYLNNTFIQLLFDSLSEYRYAWQLSSSTTLSLSLFSLYLYLSVYFLCVGN